MLPEMIIDSLHSTVLQGIEPIFTDYVRRHYTTRWLMFSDYVLKHPGRPNDTFAFSLVPGGDHLAPLNADFAEIATKDLKHTRRVSEPMLHLLTDERIFTFCFIVKPSRMITRNLETLRPMLDSTIAMMERWEDAQDHRELIGQFKAMRRKAASRSFNIRLVDNIILASTFAAFLTYLICKQVPAERVGWFSDRDSITFAHQNIANCFYGANVSACCQRLMNGWRGPALGLNGPAEEGGSLWCDAHLRVPDHFAGAVSAWDIEQHLLVSDAPKYSQVLLEGIADRPNVCIVRMNFDWQSDQLAVSASHVTISRKQ